MYTKHCCSIWYIENAGSESYYNNKQSSLTEDMTKRRLQIRISDVLEDRRNSNGSTRKNIPADRR